MKILQFADHKEKFKFLPGSQSGDLFFETGEFISEVDVKAIVLCSMNNEGFLKEINECCKTNFTPNTNIEELELVIREENFTEGIPDGDHEDFNYVEFEVKGEPFLACWDSGPYKFPNAKLLEKCSGICVFEATGTIVLKLEF